MLLAFLLTVVSGAQLCLASKYGPQPDLYIRHGICGTIFDLPCPDGLTCKLDGDFFGARGKCFIENPKTKDDNENPKSKDGDENSKTIDACLQPKKIGPCKAAIPRFFYNKDTHECELFTWGGCQPNENNFLSLAECKKKCETQ